MNGLNLRGLTAPFLFIFILFCCLICPVSGATFDLPVSADTPQDIIFYDDEIYILQIDTSESYGELNKASVNWNTNAISYTNEVYDIQTDHENIGFLSDGNLIYVRDNGQVFRTTNYTSSTYNASAFGNSAQMGDLIDSGINRFIVVDGYDNVYVNTEEEVYKFVSPTYSSAIFADLTNAPFAVDFKFERPHPLITHQDGLFFVHDGESNGAWDAYTYDGVDYSSSLIDIDDKTGLDVDDYDILDGVITTNRDFYVVICSETGGNDKLGFFDYSDNYNYTEMLVASSQNFDHLCIDDDGIIYILDQANDKVYTSITYGQVGAYTAVTPEGTVPPGLTYNTKEISSIYDSYYNNSDLEFGYNINVDLDSTTGSGLTFNEFKSGYNFEVDLVNPTGVRIDTLEILGTSFQEDYIFAIRNNAKKSGTLTYSGTWVNGTWSVYLYEIDTDTNSRALLDSDTFLVIADQQTSVITDSDTGDMSSNVSKLLDSGLFAGIVIMMALLALTVSVAGQSTTSVIMGGTIGLIVSSLLGFFPTWTILVLMAVCAVILGGRVFGGGD